MNNYHPKFCYGTHTTHGQKVYFLYPFFKYSPLIPRFVTFRIFRVLKYSIYSVFQYSIFPCYKILRVFRILEYSVCSAIPPNRVTRYPPWWLNKWQSDNLLTVGSELWCRQKRMYLSSWPWLPTVTMPDHTVITTLTFVVIHLKYNTRASSYSHVKLLRHSKQHGWS